jgi:predicted DNA-binding transcriptional regulator AlpA
MSMNDEDRLLTKAEVAERLRLPLKTVDFWRAQGKGPKGRRIGNRVLYRASDLERWIADQWEDVPRKARGRR